MHSQAEGNADDVLQTLNADESTFFGNGLGHRRGVATDVAARVPVDRSLAATPKATPKRTPVKKEPLVVDPGSLESCKSLWSASTQQLAKQLMACSFSLPETHALNGQIQTLAGALKTETSNLLAASTHQAAVAVCKVLEEKRREAMCLKAQARPQTQTLHKPSFPCVAQAQAVSKVLVPGGPKKSTGKKRKASEQGP